jgi:radical SAM-linked protein
MKIRIKFRRFGAVKFLGHLDLMRYFQKAMRRADIDICYSEGFSPHQIMSFAAPLGVGIISDGEYFDIEVNSSMTSEQAMRALNDTMVEGIEVTGYVLLPDDAKNAMSIVAAADYRLTYKNGFKSPYSASEWQEIVKEQFYDKPSFTIIKKTKKSERELDLKPLVYALKVSEDDDGSPAFFMKLSTGSIDNIKPELVLASLYEKLGLTFDERAVQIHRLEVYAKTDDGEFVSLLDFGSDILPSE